MADSRFFSRLTTAFLLILLSACATPPVYQIGPRVAAPTEDGATKVTIEDKRPESDKANSVGSFFVGSDSYGMLTLGDVSFTPPVIEALRLNVQQAASTLTGVPPQHIVLTVERMSIQDNRKQLFLGQGSRGLLLPSVIGEALSGVAMDINKLDPFIVATFSGQANIDGVTKHLSVSKESKGYSHMSEDARAQAVQETLRDFLQAISAQVVGGSKSFQRNDSALMESRNTSSASGAAADKRTTQNPTADKAPKLKFGKFSYTIEGMAKATGCKGGSGAYLTTDAGPIENYRIDCEGGATFLARCEYGKCAQQ